LSGVLSVRIYDKEHSLTTLLEAGYRLDTGYNHLISVPRGEGISDYGGTNAMGDKLFNIYELNKALSTIHRDEIRERKRQYSIVYQVRNKDDT
jgi:hypothetical protein